MLEKLHLIDRFILLSMIPAKGNWAQNKVWEDCRTKLEFTTDEIIKYGLQITQSGLQWRQVIDPEFDEEGKYIEGTGTAVNLLQRVDEPIDNPLSEKEMKICQFAKTLKKLARDGELMGVQINLYEEFVGPAPLDIDFLAAEAEKAEIKEDEEWEAEQSKDDDEE